MSIILFDGVCHLCNDSVRFVIRHDRARRFRFAHLQSAVGQELMRSHGVATDDLSSFLLIEGESLYRKSEAWLRILAELGWPWKLAGVFRLVPAWIRDRVYDWVGRHRYQWFGRDEQCLLPGPDILDRFLDRIDAGEAQ